MSSSNTYQQFSNNIFHRYITGLYKFRFYISFRFHIHRISFKRNDYFIPNSRYSVFLNKKRRMTQIKTDNIKDLQQCSNLPLEDVIKVYAILYQTLDEKYREKYKPLTKTLVVRQLTRVNDFEEIYCNVGQVELNLHELMAKQQHIMDHIHYDKDVERGEFDYVMPIIDPKGLCEGNLFITVAIKVKNDPYHIQRDLFVSRLYRGLKSCILGKSQKKAIVDRWTANEKYFDVLRKTDQSEFSALIWESKEIQHMKVERGLYNRKSFRGMKVPESTDSFNDYIARSSQSNDEFDLRISRKASNHSLTLGSLSGDVEYFEMNKPLSTRSRDKLERETSFSRRRSASKASDTKSSNDSRPNLSRELSRELSIKKSQSGRYQGNMMLDTLEVRFYCKSVCLLHDFPIK